MSDRSVIILDRDRERAQNLASAFDAAGYAPLNLDDCHAARMLAQEMLPKAIIIGSISEFVAKGELCAALRAVAPPGKVLIVVLLSSASDRLRILCLDSGADFCLDEAIAPASVVRRIQAVADRAVSGERVRLVYKSLVVDLAALKATVNGAPLPLRPKEFQLLRVLIERPEKTLKRPDILAYHAWGGGEDCDRALDFSMFRLRTALARAGLPRSIHTVRKVGYKLLLSAAAGLVICAAAPSDLVVEAVAAEEVVLAFKVDE